jgi:beta-N-acetylhexosaminidase
MPENAYGPNIVSGVETLFTYQEKLGRLPVNIYHYDENKETFTNQIVYKRGYGLSYKKEKVTKNNPKRPVILFILMGIAGLLLMGISLIIKRRIKCQ